MCQTMHANTYVSRPLLSYMCHLLCMLVIIILTHPPVCPPLPQKRKRKEKKKKIGSEISLRNVFAHEF